MPSLDSPTLGAVGEPAELLLLLLLMVLLLVEEYSVTSSKKKSWRPTSQLEAAVAACMTLARHVDEVQSVQTAFFKQTRHWLQKEEWHSSCAGKHGQKWYMHCNDALQTHRCIVFKIQTKYSKHAVKVC